MTTGANLSVQSTTDATLTSLVKFFGIVLMAVIMVDVISKALTPSLSSQYIQSRMYQGRTDPRVVDVTDELQILSPITNPHYTAWVSAEFINDGPDPVYIAINYADETFEVKRGETAAISRIGALERISNIYFICDTGKTASVRVIGEF